MKVTRSLPASFSLCLILLLSNASSFAQLVPPKFTKNSLLNGLQLLILPGEGDPQYFALMIKNGAAFDPAGKWGATYVMAHLLLERTERRTGPQIREDLALMGAEIQVEVDWDGLFFFGRAPRSRMEDTLNVLAEVVTKPRFEEGDFERLRSKLLDEVSQEITQAQELSERRFNAVLFGDNPYAQSCKGTPQSLQDISLNDIKIQYRRLVLPNQAQLAFYYSGDTTALFRSLGRNWGSWVRDDPAPFTFRQADPVAGPRLLLVDRPTEQALLTVGNLAVHLSSGDFYALKVLEQYLTACLPVWAAEVTSERQIEGGVRLAARRMPGAMYVSIRSPAQYVAEYVERLRAVLEEIRSGRVDPDLLSESRELAVSDLRRQLSQPLSTILLLLRAELYEVGLRYISNYPLRLDRVKAAQLTQAVSNFFSPDSYLLVVVGPAGQIGPALEKLGPVEILQ